VKLVNLEDLHLTLILQGLEMNTCLQSLSLKISSGQQAITLAIQNLLERTSIQCLELEDHSFTEESFRPICQALIHSTTVSKVQFNWCDFSDAGSVDLFRQLLQTKPNLQLLKIGYCSFFGNSKAHVGDTMSAALLQPNSMLRSLELMQRDLNPFFPGPTFGELLSAVGRSSLERFSIGCFQSEAQFQTLMSSLPAMKIQELEFCLNGPLRVGADRKQDLLRAVKRNFSLQSLKITLADGRAVFTEEDNMRLQFFFDRNKRLAQWVASPATVPCLLWPDALGLALQAGEDPLFCSLQAVLGDEVESTSGTRKRKR